MPHRRSAQGRANQQKRRQHYLVNYVIPEQKRPRYTVAKTFTAKSISEVDIHSDASLIMKHFRNAAGKCFDCGSTENLHAHHIDKNHSNNTTENLMVLCASCHKKLHLELNKCHIATEEVQKLEENVNNVNFNETKK